MITKYKNQNITREEAQRTAAAKIEQIRYGDENKDYFWIIDEHPTMIMHPYISELIDSDLTEYKDPKGKNLFVEATELVAQDGEGYIDYMWQWKDDSTRIVPKLSYVRGYKPWGWIIGTGIYLEDVNEEIKTIRKRLVRISLLITLFISVVISFVIRQSLNIENKRKDAESELLLSKQKYKSLVEASTEGTLMLLGQAIIFSNIKFNDLIGFDSSTIMSLKFEDIFTADWDLILLHLKIPKNQYRWKRKSFVQTNEKDVMLSVSEINYGV